MEEKFAICNISMVPLRKEPTHRSEMVSTLIFGETFTILESKENWHYIKCNYDNYEGWITARKLYEITKDKLNEIDDNSNPAYVTGIPFYAFTDKNEKFLLSPGSRLPEFNDNYFKIGENQFTFDGEISIPDPKTNYSRIMPIARLFLGTPYLWGGRSIFGIDCSGLTQVVFMLCGYKLPRDAYQQAELGKTIASLSEAKEGDLAFFSENGTRITHVGILDGNGNILHASEKVRIDSIDGKGIFNKEINKHTLEATLIKRYF